jgi:D-glycero-D-manno-heptose 1,7-bisphosphate phosphatase
MHTTKLIIFGRDGILNKYREDHVKAPSEWVPIPGALEAVARLNHAGWHAVVATNQAGIGRGLIDMAAVNAVHAHMNHLLLAQGGRLDAVFFCPHTPEEGCGCRKPLPGMMRDIGQRYGVDLRQAGRTSGRRSQRGGRLIITSISLVVPALIIIGIFGFC